MAWETLGKGVAGATLIAGILLVANPPTDLGSHVLVSPDSRHQRLVGTSVAVPRSPGDTFDLIVLPTCNSCQASAVDWITLAHQLETSKSFLAWVGSSASTNSAKTSEIRTRLRRPQITMLESRQLSTFPSGIYSLRRSKSGGNAIFQISKASPLPVVALGRLKR
jgi:hypothetical protein